MIALTLFATFYGATLLTNLGTLLLFKSIDIKQDPTVSFHPTCCKCADPKQHLRTLIELDNYLNFN